MGHMIPSEAASKTSGEGGSGEAVSSRSNTTLSESREGANVEGPSVSVAVPPSQEEHIDSVSDHDEGEETDLDEDASTEGDRDEGKGGALDGARECGASDESGGDKTTHPLMEYIVNVVHFLDSILSNNSTDDHMREFITQGGLGPLLKILSLPVLSLDFPTSSACLAIAGPCRSILVRANLCIFDHLSHW